MLYQTRCVSIFNDKQGFASGSIEGRVAIENFNELGKKRNLIFFSIFFYIFLYFFIYLF